MKKNILKVGSSLLIFNYLSVLIVLLLVLLCKMNFDEENYFSLVILNFISSGAIMLAILGINFEIVKDGFKKLREVYHTSIILKFLKKVIIVFLIMYLVRFISSYITLMLGELINISEVTVDNQELIEKLLGSAPTMMIISACLFAPISEELLFRGAMRKAIKNKWVFITVSGLTFGLAHVTDSFVFLLEILIIGIIISYIMSKNNMIKQNKIKLSVTLIVLVLLLCGGIFYFQYGNLFIKIMSLDKVEIIGSITYIAMGAYLAYIYYKEENILLNMVVHALSNILSMIALLFLI